MQVGRSERFWSPRMLDAFCRRRGKLEQAARQEFRAVMERRPARRVATWPVFLRDLLRVRFPRFESRGLESHDGRRRISKDVYFIQVTVRFDNHSHVVRTLFGWWGTEIIYVLYSSLTSQAEKETTYLSNTEKRRIVK